MSGVMAFPFLKVTVHEPRMISVQKGPKSNAADPGYAK